MPSNQKKIKHSFYTKSKIVDRAADIFIYFTIAFLAILCVLPFVHVLAKSLSSDAKVTSQLVYLIPKDFNLRAYRSVIGDPSMILSLWQTVKVTVIFTALGMLLTICAAYPLTRKRLKGRNIISVFFIITLYFSGGIIPDYLLMHRLGLLNKTASLILPLAFSAYNMIIMKTSIQTTVPDSLEESALLDGANDIRILVQIVLPLCKPILATLCLFYAVGRWNAYQDSVFYITRQPLYLLQHKLNLLIQTTNTTLTAAEAQPDTVTNPEVIKSACIIFATLPIVIVYPFVQKYFVKGVMIGAVKG